MDTTTFHAYAVTVGGRSVATPVAHVGGDGPPVRLPRWEDARKVVVTDMDVSFW